MDPANDPVTEDDPVVMQAAREYLAALEAGQRPDRRAYLTRHPEFAGALAECFDGIELAHAAAGILKPSAPVGPTSASEFPADPLGDFQIVREIGRGGMGVVYEAVQLSLGRRVALKVLPFASALDAKHLQRFKTEAHAAAQLHHTNIVPVYAVGCERGVHFYAMQLIEGRPLDAVIAELREGRGKDARPEAATQIRSSLVGATQPHSAVGELTQPRSRSGYYRAVARVTAQVADALEYAHEAGVVHRDVKPANLLLDAKGNVWVTDFGLAHVAADVSLTQTGNVVGTLRYMSPEQASGRRSLVDHRADVYSLGATLYELLTLEPLFPLFVCQDRQALLQKILHDDPAPPRQLERSIPVELETIVLKALAKAPAERYATAGALATDLRRFLDERPILARRPTVVERFRKWMRRHPSTVGAVVLILVGGVVSLGVSTALIARERAKEQQRAREAEDRFQLARRAVDKLIELANGESADNPHVENLRREMLEAALEYYQEFLAQPRSDQAELEATRDRVKKILDDLAVLQGGGQAYLLLERAVLDDLKLNPEQRKHAAGLMDELQGKRMESFREFHRLNAEERRQRFVEMIQTDRVAVLSMLTGDQNLRLGQIALQLRGPMALRDPEVAAALRLTAAQKDQLRALEADGHPFGRGGERFRPGPGGPGGPSRRQFSKQILDILTAEQLTLWKEMIGPPYTGPEPMPFRGRGGPGGPFGGPEKNSKKGGPVRR